MRRTQSLTTSRGFSILELLVAMAIIATLLMIVLPTYRNWTAKTEAAAVAELIHNINLGVGEFATSTGEYPEADGFGFSPWGRTPVSLKDLLKDADFRGPGEIRLAYWYVEPAHPHGPPQLKKPPHAFHGQGLHLGWADNTAPSPVLSSGSGGGTIGGGTDSTPDVPAPGNNPPGDKPPGDKPPGDKPPGGPTPPANGPGNSTPPPGSTDTSGSTDDKRPVIFGGPTGSSGDCDPAIYDDCGPGQPQVAQVPDNPPRIGYIAVHAPTAEGQAVLRRLMSLFPQDQVRPLDPAPEVILVRLQE